MNTNSNINNDNNPIQPDKEETNLYSNNLDKYNIQNSNNNMNNLLSNNDQNFTNENNFNNDNNNSPPNYLLEKLNSKSINEYINSLLFEIKKLKIENEELKLNFVQVSELREKETQNYKYNLNVLKSNIEILEQDKQRHINQNIIEKENLENQLQILTKENNILNQRIKEIIEQNEILNKQIFDLNILNFGKNKKMQNVKEPKNKFNKNNNSFKADLGNNISKIKKDKSINMNNSNIKSKNNFSINFQTESKNKINNYPTKISKTSKFNESNNLINLDKNFSIEINKFDKDIIKSNTNINSNLLSKESTKFNIIENDFENNYNEEENKKYIPQKFSEYQAINDNEKNNNKDENNEMKKRNEDILHFANKYLKEPNFDNKNINSDILLKNDSVEIKNKDFEQLNKLNINNIKNIDET